MKKKTKGLWIAWLLVLPVVIVRAFTTLYPIIMTFINSTYDMSLLKGNNFQFIGLENYLRIFEDQKLLSSYRIYCEIYGCINVFPSSIRCDSCINVKYEDQR